MKKILAIVMISCFALVACGSTGSPPVKIEKYKIEKSISCDQAYSVSAVDHVGVFALPDVSMVQPIEAPAFTVVYESPGVAMTPKRLCSDEAFYKNYHWLVTSISGYRSYDMRQRSITSRPGSIPIDVAWLITAHDKS